MDDSDRSALFSAFAKVMGITERIIAVKNTFEAAHFSIISNLDSVKKELNSDAGKVRAGAILTAPLSGLLLARRSKSKLVKAGSSLAATFIMTSASYPLQVDQFLMDNSSGRPRKFFKLFKDAFLEEDGPEVSPLVNKHNRISPILITSMKDDKFLDQCDEADESISKSQQGTSDGLIQVPIDEDEATAYDTRMSDYVGDNDYEIVESMSKFPPNAQEICCADDDNGEFITLVIRKPRK